MSFPISEVTGEWDRSGLPANIRIGESCWLERPQTFERYRSRHDPGLVIGAGVRVYGWSVFNLEEDATMTVGAGSVLVGAIFMCRERIDVGRDVVISYGVTVADSDFHPRDPELRRRDAEASAPYGNPAERPEVESRPVAIGDGAWVGIGAIVLKGVRIGAGARVGAGAVVSRDVPEGGRAEGNPARVVAP